MNLSELMTTWAQPKHKMLFKSTGHMIMCMVENSDLPSAERLNALKV